jgi:hypothetical protein
VLVIFRVEVGAGHGGSSQWIYLCNASPIAWVRLRR